MPGLRLHRARRLDRVPALRCPARVRPVAAAARARAPVAPCRVRHVNGRRRRVAARRGRGPAPRSRRDTGPDTMLPDIEPIITRRTRRRRRGSNARTIAIVVVAVVGVGLARARQLAHGGHHATTAPVILAPQAPFAGTPDEPRRRRAHRGRVVASHRALGRDLGRRARAARRSRSRSSTGLQPGYQWVAGNVPSTTNTMISITSVAGRDVIAVSGTNHDDLRVRPLVSRARGRPT